MKLWIDDIRTPPDESWRWAKTSDEANDILCSLNEYWPTLISFDHDLGGEDTAMLVVDCIEQILFDGSLPVPSYTIHSMNPVGRNNIHAAMRQMQERLTRVRHLTTKHNHEGKT